MVCDCGSVELKLEARNVLILVLMEYGLRLTSHQKEKHF